MHGHGMYDRPNMSEPLVFSDDIKIFSRNSKRSIFVRDLPYCCTSADLGDFFSHALNTPVLHAMVCRNKQGRTLQIGYVLFQSEDVVRHSLETLNGCRFIGRDIRVLPYDPKAPSEPSTTGLVHVSFKTTSTQQPLVTEATIRRAFETYGELEHVAIRTHKYTDTGLQGGYGFVTFRRPELNRYVIEQVRQLETNGVFYECSWSSLHTHKGATGEEVVIDPRYGYIATKASGAVGPGPVPSGRGLSDLYAGGSGSANGFGGHRGGNSRDRNYPPYGPEYDDYTYGRRDPREEYYYRGSGGVMPPAGAYDRVGNGYGGDYDRRGPRNAYPPVGGGLPPPPPRAYYDESYYEETYRGSRGHVSGRPPFAGGRDGGPLYDRGYYEETYRGSTGSRYGPSSLAPRPAMSGRDSLDFPLTSGGILPDDRFGFGYAPSRLGPENDLFPGLPTRPSILGQDGGMGFHSTIPGGTEHPGTNTDRDSLSVLNSAGINSSRRSVDSIAAVTDTTDLSFDFGRGTVTSSLSASAYDFYPSTLPASATAASLPVAAAAQVQSRPSRSSWGTDTPADVSRENSEVVPRALPASNFDSFWQSTAEFFQNKDQANLSAVLEEPLEPLFNKESSSNISFKTDVLDGLIDPVDQDDEEVIPRCASLNGPPPGLLTCTSTPKETSPREDEEDDTVSVPPYRNAEVLDLAKDVELKAIIQPDN